MSGDADSTSATSQLGAELSKSSLDPSQIEKAEKYKEEGNKAFKGKIKSIGLARHSMLRLYSYLRTKLQRGDREILVGY